MGHLVKETAGPDLQVHGSGDLIQALPKHDLVDEFWLKTVPVTLGRGKRLFGDGAIAAGFKLLDSRVSPLGVIVANYGRAGVVRTGSFVEGISSVSSPGQSGGPATAH